jgi:hypothetical protein
MLDVFAGSADTMDPLILGLSNHQSRRVGRRALTAQLDAILTIFEPDGQLLHRSTNFEDGNLGECDISTRKVYDADLLRLVLVVNLNKPSKRTGELCPRPMVLRHQICPSSAATSREAV